MSTTMIVYNEKHSVYNKTQFFVTVFIFKQLTIVDTYQDNGGHRVHGKHNFINRFTF